MYEEAELHDLMVALDVPPTRADVQKAIATGRRRDRRRTVFGAAAAVLVVAGAAGYLSTQVHRDTRPGPPPAGPPSVAAPPPPGCVVETYPIPAGRSDGSVNAVDDNGGHLVGALYTGDVATPVAWKDGKPVPLAGATGTPVAVNTNGVVAGFQTNQQDEYQAWIWHDGQFTMLAKVKGYKWTMPLAINAKGDVVGYAMGDALDINAPVLWPAGKPGTVVKLRLPAGVGAKGVSMSRATGIDEHGTIVGVVKGVPVRWLADGTAKALPLPAADNNGGYVNAIRGRFAFGVFYGKSTVEVVRWDLTTGTVTSLGADSGGMLSGTFGGAVVTWGEAGNPAARITPDGKRIPLAAPKGGPGVAVATSGDGTTIVGFSASDRHQPVVWHCAS